MEPQNDSMGAVIGVAPASHRVDDADLGQALGVANREVLGRVFDRRYSHGIVEQVR